MRTTILLILYGLWLLPQQYLGIARRIPFAVAQMYLLPQGTSTNAQLILFTMPMTMPVMRQTNWLAAPTGAGVTIFTIGLGHLDSKFDKR